ncbi:uncharacterized protein LOC119583250 [Penaeus monodon]|uniref:uncharacterized protein LOC119583250 n=1 Tax=Penaeus monodon TaxID=6687 RepID=UPI0018A7790B|nr:uncharacterized protein LOC119583250 [Penaeus monodon]
MPQRPSLLMPPRLALELFLEGKKFDIFTNHKPLFTIFNTSRSTYSPRQLCHIDYISQFITDIQYIRGQDNTATDALSRNGSAIDSSLIDYAANAAGRANNAELQQLKDNPAFQLKKIKVPETDHLLTSRFIWTGINKDERNWTHSCIKCRTFKLTCHTVSPSVPFKPVASRFDHVHVDFVGPLPYSSGFRYILICVDRFSRLPESIPLADIHADTVA